MIEIWLAFLGGAAGSFHCVGMCGGIVAALSMSGRDGTFRSRIRSQLFYNLGRISTYTALGAAAGWIGSSLDLPALRSVSFWFFCAANLFVIAVGVSSAFGWNRLNLSSLEVSGARFLAQPLQKLLSVSTPASAFPLGLILGFLPCGLVYAPLVVATGSKDPFVGAGIMAALGLGTVPVLFLFGTASSAISGALRSAMLRLTGVVVALMGVAGVWRAVARACPHCNL